MRNFYKAPKLYFYRFLLWWFQPIYIRIFKFKAEGLENVPSDGSFLLLSNHSHKLDPFFIGAMIRRPIFQMASNEYFRIPIMRRFMWSMGAIPRQKGFPERRSLRHALRIIKRGYPLAIFPEGGRNWDGQTLPILDSTARLVKHLNLPVITVVLKGNYLAWPRWADIRRKSPITLHFAAPITFHQKTPDEVINDLIQRSIDNNDNYTEIERIKGRRPAEGLSRLLWRCPACRTIEGLVEKKGKFIYCSNIRCGKKWEVNLHCYMREVGTNVWIPIKEYADLMFREEEIAPIKHGFADFLEEGEKVFLTSQKITLYNEHRYPKLEKIGQGRLLLTDKALVLIKKHDGGVIRYPFENIRGRSTEKNFIFQIVFVSLRKNGYTGYVVSRFEMRNESCLKWELCYDYVRQRIWAKP